MRFARRSSRLVVMRAALALALAAPSAQAAPQHCLGEPGGTSKLDETVVGIVNPLGIENQLELSVCWPLIERPGLLFDDSNVELGLYENASPIYLQQGAFVSVTPLSPLVLRAEAAAVQYWPLPLDGAGYYAVSGYRADYHDSALPAARAGGATGVEAGASATLRGEVALSRHVALVASDAIAPEYWAVGDGAFWVNERRDVILARSDWLVHDTGVVLVELARERATARVGLVDDLVAVPRAGYVANIAGGIAMIELRHVAPSLHDVSAFVRIGGYTQHAFRRGVNVLLGLSVVWARARG